MFGCVDDVRVFDVRMKRNHIQKTTDLHLKNRNKKEESFRGSSLH